MSDAFLHFYHEDRQDHQAFCAYLKKTLVAVNEIRLANTSSSFLAQELVLLAPLAKRCSALIIITCLSASLRSDLGSHSLYATFPDQPV